MRKAGKRELIDEDDEGDDDDDDYLDDDDDSEKADSNYEPSGDEPDAETNEKST